MTIYGDVLFFLNLALDYGLLLVTAKIAAAPFVRLRLLGGAALGALYSVAIFVPGFAILAALPVRCAIGAGMVLIAYGGQRRFLHLLLVFALVTVALGGGVLALTTVGGATMHRGVATQGADLLAVLLSGSVGCVVMTLLFRRRGAALRRRDYASVELVLGARRVSFRALVDTGNSLTDRNNRRVIVADWQVLCALFPPQAGVGRETFVHPSAGFRQLVELVGPGRMRLLSYRTVGTADGLLLAVRPDQVTINGRQHPGVLAAGVAQPVSDGGEYQGLIGPEEMGGAA